MKKTYIAPSIIKIKTIETTGWLLAGSQGKRFVVHEDGSHPQDIKDDDDLADKAWSKKNNDLWDNDEW